MPARAYAFPEHDLLLSRFEGELTGELLLGHYRQLVAIDAEAPLHAEVVDFRGVTGTDVTPSTLRRVGEQIAHHYPEDPGQLRCAVLAPTDLGFGISRMYEMGSSPDAIDTQVFRTLDEALSWLLETDPATRDELAGLLESPHHERLLFEVGSPL
jgi:hypothetical protein